VVGTFGQPAAVRAATLRAAPFYRSTAPTQGHGLARSGFLL